MLGPGELFGDFESFCNLPYHEFTLVCKSIKGEILVLDKMEFAKKISIIPKHVVELIEKSKEKRFLYYRQLVNAKHVHKR